MPEIAEVARIVHFLRLHLVGKTIRTASAVDDQIVFGKAGTTGDAVSAALTGRKVISSGSQGKLFWLVLDKAPHVVMHFGMTGWLQIRGVQTSYSSLYRDTDTRVETWPPKYTKFHLTTTCNPAVEVAFTDYRRLARVRLVDCPGADIRSHAPLKENGPDPVQDTDRFTLAYFQSKCRASRAAVKAMLLNQKFISGIGNWVGDEVLFQSRIHPEQRCNHLTDAQTKTLYEVIRYVCQTAVGVLGDYHQFPSDWLFKYRWSKGSENPTLPGGEPLAHVTVGNRTSCYATRLQKITLDGVPVVVEEEKNKEEVVEEEDGGRQEEKKPAPKGRKRKAEWGSTDMPKPKARRGRRAAVKKTEEEEQEEEEEEEGVKPSKPVAKRGRKALMR
ncbi:hypothetical protein QC762_406840 [Podospora pseudocomata]|uniref:Formamidopyrimidine-DNA glycosylase catalytic domain-containing protein n=1 Tax=Podospora pseudocomata TaxID=2093779 RepID=A0ABR0GGI0_9PEZI|nr:hypothetical protein QC762_406840 [Podospora pseudocomata]